MKEPCEKTIDVDTLSGPERLKRKHWRTVRWSEIGGMFQVVAPKNHGIQGFQQDLGSFSI